MNRFLLWNHETLAKFANDLFTEHMTLKKQAAKCVKASADKIAC